MRLTGHPLPSHEHRRPPRGTADSLTPDTSLQLPLGSALSWSPCSPPLLLGPHCRAEDSRHRLRQARGGSQAQRPLGPKDAAPPGWLQGQMWPGSCPRALPGRPLTLWLPGGRQGLSREGGLLPTASGPGAGYRAPDLTPKTKKAAASGCLLPPGTRGREVEGLVPSSGQWWGRCRRVSPLSRAVRGGCSQHLPLTLRL